MDVRGNAWWFYYNSNHNAINWYPVESTNGAQSKVNDHAKNSGIHITSTERTKWNSAQLSKITNDVGGVSFAVNAGEDMLQAIVNRGRGMGTFYAIGTAANSPSTASTRGFYQMTSQSTDGKGNYGWVYAMDYRNNVFTNYYDGNSVGWTGWNRIITANDLAPAWTEVPLKNGAKHGDRKVMCTTVGRLLYLKGEIITNRGVIFGTLPASYRPEQLRSRLVPIFGTTGMTKLYIETNGNMRLEGQIADKSENITSYGLDEIIVL
ncbi:hypothetical protein CPT06_11860 [Bacillus vallismortis]|nr:hypothetical protein CPT06_11860 [Bacillus vallismortis]